MVTPILRQNKSVEAEQIQKHIGENFNKLNSLINCVVGAVNTIAGRAVFDAKSELFKRKDIEALLECDAIYLCEGWQNSKGCMAEFEVARIYGKEIMFE